MEGSREAEMIVTFALEGINYACRLSGAFAKNIAAMIAAVAKTPGNSPGKTRMKQLMQSGEPLDYYVVPEAKMKEFAQLAKKYGIQYCVAMNQDGAYDLIVKKSKQGISVHCINTMPQIPLVGAFPNPPEKEKGKCSCAAA